MASETSPSLNCKWGTTFMSTRSAARDEVFPHMYGKIGLPALGEIWRMLIVSKHRNLSSTWSATKRPENCT